MPVFFVWFKFLCFLIFRFSAEHMAKTRSEKKTMALFFQLQNNEDYDKKTLQEKKCLISIKSEKTSPLRSAGTHF